MPVAFVTGITGQDGSYLADLLLGKGYEVHGLIRRASTFNTERIEHLYLDPHEHGDLHLHYGDMTDGSALSRLLHSTKPDEIYNLAAQSHVRVSFDCPVYTCEVNALGTLNLLEAIRSLSGRPRLYQAGSSEMFGNAAPPQSESTPFRPRSPYAAAKVFAFHQVANYREAYGIFGCNGILFNHESERRGPTFLTRKVAQAVARIKHGQQKTLYLGNLLAERDWGYAPEYVDAMWRMLQQDEPNDYVIATGVQHSVREFAKAAFLVAGLEWERYVEVDERYLRPTEVDSLCGNAGKAKLVLGWESKVGFEELVRIMVEHELEAAG